MMRFLRGLRPSRMRFDQVDALADFLARHAAYVSQRSTIEYCRARAGVGWSHLVRDAAFTRAIERCRWEAYAAVLADLAEVAQIHLRQQGVDASCVTPGLIDVAGRALLRHPVPAHRADWDETLAALASRLHEAAKQPPRPVHEVGLVSARRVFEVLPLHTNLAGHDREMVTNSVRFLLCRVHADLEAAADGVTLGRRLAAIGAAPALQDRPGRPSTG